MTPTPTQALEPVEVTQADEQLTAEILGCRDWGEATDYRNSGEHDRKRDRILALVARHRQSSNAASVGVDDRAIRWIKHNLRLAEHMMKTSADQGNGYANFAAHDAHHALSAALASLSTPTAEPTSLSPEPVQKLHELPRSNFTLHRATPDGHRPCRHCDGKDDHCSVCEGVGYLPSVLSDPHPLGQEYDGDALREALAFIDKFFEPWGSWKTVWWEGEVSSDAAFSADNALKHVANILRRALSATPPAQEGEGDV